jgi:hypothetical protein
MNLIPAYRHLDEIHRLTNELVLTTYDNTNLIAILNNEDYGEPMRKRDPISYKESFEKFTEIYNEYKTKCDHVISKMNQIKKALKRCIHNANIEIHDKSLNENIKKINNTKLKPSLAKRALDRIKELHMVLPTEQHMMVKDFVNSSSSRKSTKSKSPKTSRGGLNKTRKK